jgi:hypothetical protein
MLIDLAMSEMEVSGFAAPTVDPGLLIREKAGRNENA